MIAYKDTTFIGTSKQLIPHRIHANFTSITTTKGIILLELSNKTPLHRANFIKIVKEGRLDSMIFHRVLEDFVVQAGEYDALKSARMDASVLEKLDYTIFEK